MTVGSPAHQALARRIVDDAVLGKTAPAEIIAAIKLAFDQLDQTMSAVIGALGFRAVMARAVELSEGRLRWMAAEVCTRESKAAAGDALAMAEREEPAVVVDAAMSLLATVLDLLSDFIGEDLTLRLLGRAWPRLAGVTPGQDRTGHHGVD